MSDKYIRRITKLTVVKDGKPLFDESLTNVSIDDEAGGEFVIVSQVRRGDAMTCIQIDPSEWPAIRDAIDQLVAECRVYE